MIRLLRTLLTTAGAMASATVNTMIRRRVGERVVLEVGDAAPLFTLAGSDGATYRLADLIGRHAVVIAWFPKAFTGG